MTVETSVIDYNITDGALQELRAKYEIIPDASTPQGYKDLKTGIAELRETWVGVEKHRKFLKADALEYGRKVDAEAKRITAELTAIVEPLKEAKAKEDQRKAEIKEEKKRAEEARITAIEARKESIRYIYRESMGKSSQHVSEKLESLKAMEITEDDYQEMTERAITLKDKIVKMMESLLAQTIEQERVAKDQAEREAELKRREEEAEKQRIERERLEAIEREKREAKELAERQERERLQKIEDEKQAKIREEEAEKLRLEREEIEKLRKEQEEKARIEREKIEAERLDMERKQKEAEADRMKELERQNEARLQKEQEEKRQAEEKEAKERYEASYKNAYTAIYELGGIADPDAAREILDAIIAGNIPHINFNA